MLEAIAGCPSVSDVAPVHNGTAQIVYGNLNWSTQVQGTTPAMLNVRDWPSAVGRSFTEDDVRSATKVALIGQTIVDNLFGGIDPVDQIIRIKKIPFRVVGVLDTKGQSPGGQDQDDTILVPVTTAQKKLFGTSFSGNGAHHHGEGQKTPTPWRPPSPRSKTSCGSGITLLPVRRTILR